MTDIGRLSAPAVPVPPRIGDRTVRRAAGLGLAWLAIIVVLVAVLEASLADAGFVVDVLRLVPTGFAVGLAVWATVRTRGGVRAAWALLSISAAGLLAGEIVAFPDARVDRATSVSAADVLLLVAYAFALSAVLVGVAGAGYLRRIRGLLDAGLLALGLGALFWDLVLVPGLPTDVKPGDAVPFVRPVLGLTVVALLVTLGLAGNRRLPAWVVLVGSAFGAAAITEVLHAYLTGSSHADSVWFHLGWQVQAVLLCLAAVAAVRAPRAPVRERVADRDVTAWPLVIAAVAASAVLLIDALTAGFLTTKTLVLVLVLFAGVVARQIIVVRDRTRLAAQLAVALREQERLAVTDALTGAHNRRYFEEALRTQARRARRDGAQLSVLLADIDEFKRINDSYGHPAGDAVLVAVAERIRGAVRPGDVVARYGGEEFGCLLSGVDDAAARVIAERMRRTLAGAPVPIGAGQAVRLSASLGLATADGAGRPPIDTEELVRTADAALYRAKAGGRNRVVSARSGVSQRPLREHKEESG